MQRGCEGQHPPNQQGAPEIRNYDFGYLTPIHSHFATANETLWFSHFGRENLTHQNNLIFFQNENSAEQFANGLRQTWGVRFGERFIRV
jgi:hypothetical protein